MARYLVDSGFFGAVSFNDVHVQAGFVTYYRSAVLYANEKGYCLPVCTEANNVCTHIIIDWIQKLMLLTWTNTSHWPLFASL